MLAGFFANYPQAEEQTSNAETVSGALSGLLALVWRHFSPCSKT